MPLGLLALTTLSLSLDVSPCLSRSRWGSFLSLSLSRFSLSLDVCFPGPRETPKSCDGDLSRFLLQHLVPVKTGDAFESPAGIDPKISGASASHALSINFATPYDFGSDLLSLNANLIPLSVGGSQAEGLKGISELPSSILEDSEISPGVDTRIPKLSAIGEEEEPTAIVSAEFRRKYSCLPNARLNAKVNPSALGEKFSPVNAFTGCALM